MRGVRTALVFTLFGGAALALILAAPFGDLTRVFAYVLLVETPAVVAMVVLLNLYIEWESRR